MNLWRTCGTLGCRDRERRDGRDWLDKELGVARRLAVEGDRHEHDLLALLGGEAVVEGHVDAAVRVVHLGGGLIEARASGALEALLADLLEEAAVADELMGLGKETIKETAGLDGVSWMEKIREKNMSPTNGSVG